MAGFVHELNRRKVIRVTVMYLLAGWVLVEVLNYGGAAVSLPTWAVEAALALFALGIPVTIILSWVYEITPDGIKRQSKLDVEPTPIHMTRLMHSVISALIILAIGFAAWELGFRFEKELGQDLDYSIFSSF